MKDRFPQTKFLAQALFTRAKVFVEEVKEIAFQAFLLLQIGSHQISKGSRHHGRDAQIFLLNSLEVHFLTALLSVLD